VLKPVFSVEDYGAAVDLGRDHLKLGQFQLWAVSLNDVT
jgi:hypothetical protein